MMTWTTKGTRNRMVKSVKKTYVVGVAGGSASGKSTFTEILTNKLSGLKVHIFHMDNYFKEENERPHTPSHINGIVYMDDNHPLTMDLSRLADDIRAEIDRSTYDIIIIEGLLTLWDDAIYSMLDLKLFIDCRADERIVRRLRRNMAGGLSFEEISAVYLDMVRFRHDQYVEPSKWRADLILNGSLPFEYTADFIVIQIQKIIR